MGGISCHIMSICKKMEYFSYKIRFFNFEVILGEPFDVTKSYALSKDNTISEGFKNTKVL